MRFKISKNSLHWDEEEKYELNIPSGLNDEETVLKEINFPEETRTRESIQWAAMLTSSVWMHSCEGLGYIWKEAAETDGAFLPTILRGAEN